MVVHGPGSSSQQPATRRSVLGQSALLFVLPFLTFTSFSTYTYNTSRRRGSSRDGDDQRHRQPQWLPTSPSDDMRVLERRRRFLKPRMLDSADDLIAFPSPAILFSAW